MQRSPPAISAHWLTVSAAFLLGAPSGAGVSDPLEMAHILRYSIVAHVEQLWFIPQIRWWNMWNIPESYSTFDIHHSALRQAGGEGRTPLSPELIPVAAFTAPRLRTPELDPAVPPVLRAPPRLLCLS